MSWSDSHEVTTFLTFDNVYILVCTDCLSCPTYISLVERIGLFCPNKRQFTSEFASYSYYVLLLDSWLNRVLSVLLLSSICGVCQRSEHLMVSKWSEIFSVYEEFCCVKPCMLLNQVCHGCVRFGEC